MKRIFALLAFLLLLPVAALAQNFLFPSSPAINQQVTGPNGQVYIWDGTKWVHAPAAAALPAANPTYTGTMTGPNLNLTGALTFSGNAVGGACPANQYMTVLSGTLIPTCAPVTSVGGVAGPFLTSFNPTFSGTLSGVNLSITGTVSLPSGVITDANLANAYSGIGTCAAGNFVSVLNRNAAPTCTAPPGLGTAPGPFMTLQSSSSNATVWNPRIGVGMAPDANASIITTNYVQAPYYQMQLANGAAGGGYISGAGPAPPGIVEAVIQEQSGVVGSGTWDNYYGGITGGYGNSQASSLILASGAYYNGTAGSGSYGFTATYPNASTIQLFGQTIDFTLDGGNPGVGQGVALTPGGTIFTSTTGLPNSVPLFRFWAHNKEMFAIVTDGGVYGQANATSLQNSVGVTGQGVYAAQYVDYCGNLACNDTNSYYLAVQANGPGSTVATPLGAIIQDTAPAGLSINNLTNSVERLYSGGVVTVVTNGATVSNGSFVAQFQGSTSQVHGIILPGYASGINNVSGSALMIGNAYIGTETWGNLDISGASYYDAPSGQWLADGGAGGGTTLFQMLANGWLFYTGPAVTGGTPVTWTLQAGVGTTGFQMGHMINGGWAGVPAVINGQVNVGSRDTAGYFMPSAWPIQLNFSKPFPYSATCTANALGQAFIVYTSNNAPDHMQFGCATPGGGVCPTGTWFSYHCFGEAGS